MTFIDRVVRPLRAYRAAKSEFFPYQPEKPWPLPPADKCMFYHSIDLPDGEAITGAWDIRGGFDQYIGHYPIGGKTVLDVGTASGFLAFEAEKAGAIVTATDAKSAIDFRQIQFSGTPFHNQREEWSVGYDAYLVTLKNSFWYSHRKLRSKVEVIYAPIEEFPHWDRQFDVVIAGAIIEHLSDPVTAIGNIARLAREAVILPLTPVDMTDDQLMRTATDWGDRQLCYTWWILSHGLYKRVFDNLGFSVELVPATAKLKMADGQFMTAERPTIIARRR